MDTWYEDGLDELLDDMAETIEAMVAEGASFREIAEITYSSLKDGGLIDYDTEKDIFYEWAYPDA